MTVSFAEAMLAAAEAAASLTVGWRRFEGTMRFVQQEHHLNADGRRCYIAHPLDKPCPRWVGRNFP